MTTITRDGDFYLIGSERVPVYTRVAGRDVEWHVYAGTSLRASLVGMGFKGGGAEAVIGDDGCWYIDNDACARNEAIDIRSPRAEPTALDAQRRVTMVLEALLAPLPTPPAASPEGRMVIVAYCPAHDTLVWSDGAMWDHPTSFAESAQWEEAKQALRRRLESVPALCRCPRCERDRGDTAAVEREVLLDLFRQYASVADRLQKQLAHSQGRRGEIGKAGQDDPTQHPAYWSAYGATFAIYREAHHTSENAAQRAHAVAREAVQRAHAERGPETAARGSEGER